MAILLGTLGEERAPLGQGSLVRFRVQMIANDLDKKLVDRKLRVGSSPKRVRTRLDERFHERPVLVERWPVVGGVLLESERQVRAELQLLEEGAERAEAKGPETVEELRSAHDHNCAYAVVGSSPL